MKIEKRPWQKPELIVLVRNKPEEAVLEACKNNWTPAGADSVNNACQVHLCTHRCDVTSAS